MTAHRRIRAAAVLAAGCFVTLLLAASPAAGVTIEKEYAWKTGEWLTIGHDTEDVEIPRFRLRIEKAGFRARVIRSGSADLVRDVEIEIEYRNRTNDDIEADIEIVWFDADGEPIDGYVGDEDMDEDESGEMTMTRSTPVYGLNRAKTLTLRIEYKP